MMKRSKNHSCALGTQFLSSLRLIDWVQALPAAISVNVGMKKQKAKERFLTCTQCVPFEMTKTGFSIKTFGYDKLDAETSSA